MSIAVLAHVFFRRGAPLETLIGGGRNLVGFTEILGEALGAFEPRRPFARAEGLDAGFFQIVDDADAERHFRTDHNEVNLGCLAETDHRRMVRDIDRDAFGFLGDAGIAGRAIEFVGQRARRHFPGQRVLAAAGTEDQDVQTAGLC